MSSPFIGEIRMFAGNFAPVGWAFCNGALIPISENDALFNLIGTTYGGDGQSTFALPDLRGRLPLHQGTDPATGSTFTLAQAAGVETVTLSTNQIPQHNHAVACTSNTGALGSPGNNFFAVPQLGEQMYSNLDPNAAMNANAVGPAGGSQPHENIAPYLCVDFIISLFGVFPSQT